MSSDLSMEWLNQARPCRVNQKLEFSKKKPLFQGLSWLILD